MSSPHWTRYSETVPINGPEGIKIRELINPAKNGNKDQSLAEVTFQPGSIWPAHYQKNSEKIYHITEGEGIVRRGDDRVPVRKGDTISIAAGVVHNAWNTGSEEMKLLCSVTPPFDPGDVVLVNE